MNIKLSSLAVITATFFYTGVSLAVADVPTNSAFITDKTTVFVSTPAGRSLDSLNGILCMMKQTRYDTLLGAGWYTAKINEDLCDTSGDPAGVVISAPTDGGTGGAPIEYGSWKIISARASNTAPQIVQTEVSTVGGEKFKAELKIKEASSATNLLGVFDLKFTAIFPQDMPISEVYGGRVESATASDGSTSLKYSEKGLEIGPNGQPTEVTADVYVRRDSALKEALGQGIARNNFETTKFAYNNDYFYTDNDTAQICYDRNEYATTGFQYGVYNSATGSRIAINANVNFNTKSDGKGVFGSIGEYGYWTSDQKPLADNQSVYKQNQGAASKLYRVTTRGGTLTKYTKIEQTLSVIARLPLEGPIPYVTDEPTDNPIIYRVIWDDGKLVKVAQKIGWNNLSWSNYSEPVPVEVTNLREPGLHLGIENELYRILLGNCSPVDPGKPELGYSCDAPSGSTVIVHHTAERVYPEPDNKFDLTCFEQCPQVKDNGLSTDYIDPSTDDSTSGIMYHFREGILFESNNETPVTPIAAQLGSDSDPFSVMSGVLFDAAIPANLEAIKCDPEQTQICPGKGYEELGVFYTWRSGNSRGDQLALLFDPAVNQFVKFDKPLRLEFTYPETATTGTNLPSTDATYAGAKFILTYFGFGALADIPGRCIDPTNPDLEVEDCSGEGLRWAEAFTIPAGSEATIRGTETRVLIKALLTEQRPVPVNSSSCSGLVEVANEVAEGSFLDINGLLAPTFVVPLGQPLTRVVGGVVQ